MDKLKKRKKIESKNGPANPLQAGSRLKKIRQENSVLTKEIEESINNALEGLEIKYFRNMGGQ